MSGSNLSRDQAPSWYAQHATATTSDVRGALMTVALHGNPVQAWQYGLSEADIDTLTRSFISPELIKQAQIRRVSSPEAAEILARKDSGTLSGLAFPYFRPGAKGSHLERIRLDSPPLISKNGGSQYGPKYLTPHQSRNRLYFVPGTDPNLLSDTGMDLVITEGEKKTIALYRLALQDASQNCDRPRFLPVGLPGVQGWRGVTGIAPNARGERVPTRGPIPDLDWIAWEGRRVVILFDANAATNTNVCFARLSLAAELKSRGALVYIADLPESLGVNGIDDYLHAHGAEAGLSVIEAARAYNPKERLAAIDFTDAGNEEAFELLFQDEFLYNATSSTWLKWNGICWAPDLTGRTDRAMLAVADQRLQAVSTLNDDPTEFRRTGDARVCRKAAFRAGLRLRNIQGREAAMRSAQSNPSFARRSEDFDRNDLLFACSNGVIELGTGTFRPGRRDDLITRQSPVAWVQTASYDRWVNFLNDLFPNRPDMIQFLKRAIGYSLSGLIREEVFFILHGAGRNGKGTFLRVIIAMLGDFALTTDFATLVATRESSTRPRNDIAAFAGKRFISAQESKEGTRLDEPLIKSLTGGDLITARFLHKEYFTFRPTWKIWLATNHRPEIRGDDVGIWSRPKLIPFTVSFEGREDRGLKHELLDPIQLAGVLRWAVEGCLEYLDQGLAYPQEVIDATATYRTDSDVIAKFIEERCVTGEHAQAKSLDLYNDFSTWASATGEESITHTAFGLRMKGRFRKEKVEFGARYVGIGLRHE